MYNISFQIYSFILSIKGKNSGGYAITKISVTKISEHIEVPTKESLVLQSYPVRLGV